MYKNKHLYIPPNTMLILVGTPLMGKSTWIKRTIPKAAAVISRDNIRKAISRRVSLGIGKFYETIVDKEMEEKIEKLWLDAIKWNMSRKVPIVLDTTNLTYKGRARLCQLAQKHNFISVIVVFEKQDKLKECILEDIDIFYDKARDIYKAALRIKNSDKFKDFINKMGITSTLGKTLTTRNWERLHKENIFINMRVLAAMIKRMYKDYPRNAYLKTDFYKVHITNISKPCISRCYKVRKFIAKTLPPTRPTMEGKEW